nr:Kv channel-interacting protein 1-like [Penaeus vannamei]
MSAKGDIGVSYLSLMTGKPLLPPVIGRVDGQGEVILSSVIAKASALPIITLWKLVPSSLYSVDAISVIMNIRQRKLPLIDFINQEFEDFELAPLRYRPEGLDQLCEATRFTKEELQFMYRGFKQECPTGVISEETFKEIYGKFFPLGDSAMYAHYVFGTMDQDGSGTITFGDFIMGLSVLLKGTLQERVNWIFNLYDINNDGYITREELIDIVTSIYDLMGDQANPCVDDSTAVDHVDKVFQKLDLNKDGVVTMDEFMEYCSKNENVIQSLNIFDEIH